ncbi:MAG: UDP-N-acetylmuramate:L-alanyl-gamma-D-glutamyl-meso-diaminopimelate ligase [Gammaproteobacteria bacterium RIFCSPLOWO2_02_FULL_42_14]|nr:MAG: UDP-N-acetylmuramate:L-alanyl-gamma-D-glutamyl-meso-diaminopimelate ligase [Gammaproteobacteria bacterium RIFCSPHIGHO2_02_FULL_42_43]OGT50768.1 MAG: UDP-N-acetylmuramate:L-alanyl-gamma-D-glutamyl-meso-diaminopimelate ligase [Gammaproteobacteria bacterium RIFCSPHIGHO2_12_FULL_41_25]OGT61753.1 MAG: UDP-N-acetylmuramate:L-alanyl-gamma-D-glutamyl-meso-diaminopimelate ligase [Gammaproteobacteria bacterium RIFCSPLOWO2_02_FULL_42_14]OGT85497.1 MAG: UDP-N-acetylmuramate:L-alanyl-gamma-D-glutamyl
MRIHILGICGTFMGGIALLARGLGHNVTGSDVNVYPPMSDALQAAGIPICIGYDAKNIDPKTDCVIIGNGVKRNNVCVDFILNQRLHFISGPQWIYENVLRDQHVLAVSGTHGKTTTTALLTWILEVAQFNPGFLIGGVPKNFDNTSRLGGGKYFVIEADEYDTLFCDKRAKFMHYHPTTFIINNIEYDHADIFPDIEAIKLQFQYGLRCVPSNGTVIFPATDANVADVIARGCWGNKIITGDNNAWHAMLQKTDGSVFDVYYQNEKRATIQWQLIGQHNVMNALAAIAAADSIGASVSAIEKAFATFQNVKRRLEVRGCVNNITVYDDFAHHPTAIATTIDGLRKQVGQARIIAIAEFGSNTMRAGAHKEALGPAFSQASIVHVLCPEDKSWDVMSMLVAVRDRAFAHDSVSDIINTVATQAKPGDHVLVMSNKSFGGIHQKLLDAFHVNISSGIAS